DGWLLEVPVGRDQPGGAGERDTLKIAGERPLERAADAQFRYLLEEDLHAAGDDAARAVVARPDALEIVGRVEDGHNAGPVGLQVERGLELDLVEPVQDLEVVHRRVVVVIESRHCSTNAVARGFGLDAPGTHEEISKRAPDAEAVPAQPEPDAEGVIAG